MAIDKFQGEKKSYEMPSNNLFNIVPDDVIELTYIPRSIYIGLSGDLTVVDEFDNEVTFTNLFQGTWLPIRVKLVKTASTAGNLIGMI